MAADSTGDRGVGFAVANEDQSGHRHIRVRPCVRVSTMVQLPLTFRSIGVFTDRRGVGSCGIHLMRQKEAFDARPFILPLGP